MFSERCDAEPNFVSYGCRSLEFGLTLLFHENSKHNPAVRRSLLPSVLSLLSGVLPWSTSLTPIGSARTDACNLLIRQLQGGALQQRRRPRMSNQQWEQDQRTRDEQEEMSELARVAISEGHVACLRVLVDLCSEQVRHVVL